LDSSDAQSIIDVRDQTIGGSSFQRHSWMLSVVENQVFHALRKLEIPHDMFEPPDRLRTRGKVYLFEHVFRADAGPAPAISSNELQRPKWDFSKFLMKYLIWQVIDVT